MRSNYDKYPSIDSDFPATCCSLGWQEIADRLLPQLGSADWLLCVECYPGVDAEQISLQLGEKLNCTNILSSDAAFSSEQVLRERFDRELTDDPVFGQLSLAQLKDFFDPLLLQNLKARVTGYHGRTLVIGTGASLIALDPDMLIYADMPRWEIQKRQRAGVLGNLGLANFQDRAGLKYKRAFFLDWRVADRQKQILFTSANFVLDTTDSDPKLLAAADYQSALRKLVHQPFRVVPFFDPGPWGGQWMKRVCDLPEDQLNYAWCFDCVPEENSLLLRFGERNFELPALNAVFLFPEEVLGESVHARFGKEFPIRFDLLDTMSGGNLSLQVHPLTEYIQQHFGMHYTQDESYYLLDAEPEARVWLGLRDDINPSAMVGDLRAASRGESSFYAELHIHSLPATKHDHFLIPAGTVHCSGAGSMVLEISATPYIFTFKMWDWARMGLDGRPRPVHLDHAFSNIQWERTGAWVNRHLAGQAYVVAQGEEWREERTGLHTREFIETRRHWFTGVVPHDTRGTLNVLNLVEGREAIIESPTNAFDPFVLHYAETIIIPASVGRYTIRPRGESGTDAHATIKAYIRDGQEVLKWP